MSNENYKADRAAREARRCEETILKGVPAGPAFCDRPLDDHGQCDRAGDHV